MAVAREVCTALTKLATAGGGRSQTDLSPAHKKKKKKFTSVRLVRAECKVNDVRLHQQEDAQREWIQGRLKNVQRRHRKRINAHNTYQAVSILEIVREEDDTEEPLFVFDRVGQSQTGQRRRC